ncbi:hypothetical protein GCM10023165_11080 [Variovorax defluvii]|uniref:Uncharacterized protein n=1 Tax=Variovorax defluvii TaxID=913761 RepID=A0ABP8H6V5_9BURK
MGGECRGSGRTRRLGVSDFFPGKVDKLVENSEDKSKERCPTRARTTVLKELAVGNQAMHRHSALAHLARTRV